jgi:transcriptional regulator with XRE-family HTH domain
MADKTPWERLRDWRAREGIPQHEAARRLDISRALYVAIECGEVPVRLDVVQAMEALAGIELSAWPSPAFGALPQTVEAAVDGDGSPAT